MPHSGAATEVDRNTKKKARELETQHHLETRREAVNLAHQDHVIKMSDLVNQARKYAQKGKIADEEALISQFLLHSKNHGGRIELDNAKKFVAGMKARGEIRIGSRHIGDIINENGFSQRARLGKLPQVQRDGSSAKIYSDRIIHGARVHPIDAFTGAQVTLGGITQITQRPTLTRVAILSPLSGTALIPGLAPQKKTSNDMRVATFIAASTDWSFTITISPDNMNGPRRIAEQINRVAQSMESGLTRIQPKSPVAIPEPQQVTSKIEEIKELHALLQLDVITQQEFDALKNEIITRGDHTQ